MKYKLSAIVVASTLAMALSGAAFAATSADITQTGQGHAAFIDQAGNANDNVSASIVQSGSGNRAGNPDTLNAAPDAGGILQTNNRGKTRAEIIQSGTTNLGAVVQENVNGKYASVKQTGTSNLGSIIQQDGTGGGATLTQNGQNHASAITMTGLVRGDTRGNSGTVEVSQFDRGNRAEVLQVGRGHASVKQNGNYNKATLKSTSLVGDMDVVQNGTNNVARATVPGSIQQIGNDNTAMLLGDSNSLVIDPLGYRARGEIVQWGQSNNASIDAQYSAGSGLARIEQIGSYNTASIKGGGRFAPTLSNIQQLGYANQANIVQNNFQAGSASIVQKGVAQKSSIVQTSFGGSAAQTAQTGTDNVALITQASNDNEASILQSGNRNQAQVTQSQIEGAGANMARIQQQGNDLQASITQNGRDNRAAIRQR